MPPIPDPIVYIQRDRFNDRSSDSLNEFGHWRENGSGTLRVVSNRVRLDAPDVGVYGRGVMTSLNPLSGFSTPTPAAPTQVLVEVDVILPDTLPAPGEELYAGVRILGADSGSDLSGYEWVYHINGAGVHALRLRFVNSAGVTNAGVGYPLGGSAVGAGERTTLAIELWADSTSRITLKLYRDDSGVRNLLNYAFLSLAPYNNIATAPPYMGLVLYQDGPQQSAPLELTSFCELDNFGVWDARPIPYTPFNPKPEKTPEVSLPVDSFPDKEHDPVDENIPIEPSYVRPTRHTQPVREFRSDAGYVQSSPKEEVGRPHFEIVWSGLTDAERATLKAWIETKAEFTIHDFEIDDTHGQKIWVVFKGPISEEFLAIGAWEIRGSVVKVIPSA